ncbi:MAG: tetratricopeptide repeat protein [Azospirillaceae bacterium]|nr:tetratricopeptide repeat protein [Azospirillaceae bacterium]
MGVLLAGAHPALAAPTPEQVKHAVDTGDLTGAEGMLRQAIRDHGDSARAHYELGEVLGMEGRHQDAVGELELARKIDPSLHFAATPQAFQQRLEREESFQKPAVAPVPAPQHVTQTTTTVSHPPAPVPKESSSHGMTIALLVGGLLLAALVVYLVFRRPNAAPGYSGGPRYAPAGGPPPYAPQPGPGYASGYAPGYAPVVVQENSGAGFFTGVLAGELMAGGRGHDTVVHETVINNVTENRVYEDDRRPSRDSGFDSGSASSGNDGWGGSSDGGSSSSSFDSGSSSDSGSGGGDSSW